MTTDEVAQVRATLARRAKVAFQEVRPALEKSLGDDFVGAAWAMDGSDLVVYHSLQGDLVDKIRGSLSDADLEGVAVTPVFVANGVGWETATANQSRLNDAVLEWNERGDAPVLASGGLDESCGKIVLYANAGVDLEALRQAIGEIVPEDEFYLYPLPDGFEMVDAVRDGHHDPYRSGNQIRMARNCTSNIAWEKGSEIWALTAGHCTDDGSRTGGGFFTMGQQTTQGGTRIDDGGTSPVIYVRYGGNIDAAVTRINIGADNFTNIGVGTADSWLGLNWWQWDAGVPGGSPAGIGWDAVGDWVCQAGNSSRILRCGLLDFRFETGTGSSFGGGVAYVNQRETGMDLCGGDSGGTVYRLGDLTLTGITRARIGGTNYWRNGQRCSWNSHYSHTGYVAGTFGFNNPVNMP